jgi:predicted component of type VI protein secretion system
MVYKTTQQPEPQVTTMDAQTAAGWTAWPNSHLRPAIGKALEEFAGLMGEECALQENRLVKEIRSALDEIKRLDAKIAELQTEVEILRGNAAKNVTPLVRPHVA